MLLLTFGSAQAKTVEEVTETEFTIKGTLDSARQKILVTIWRDDQRTNAPFLVLNHGRDGSKLKGYKRVRFSKASRQLVKLGFAVLVPTRCGYGETGGPDLEYTSFATGNFEPCFEAAADQGEEVVKLARSLPFVNPDRGVLMGVSYGGAMVVAMGARNLPGIKAIFNVAGGGGGDIQRAKGQPYHPHNMEQLFAKYGQTSRVPSLWLCAENDELFGKDAPRQWYRAFADAGGVAKFIMLPPRGEFGHALLAKDFDHTMTIFEQFIGELGILGSIPARAKARPPPPSFHPARAARWPQASFSSLAGWRFRPRTTP